MRAVQNHQYAELVELAGGFIHDIKNHLSNLGLNLQLLAEDFDDAQTPREQRARKRVERLQGEVGRLVELSNDVLRYIRARDLQRESTDLGEVADELVDLITPRARTHGVEIKCYLPANLPRLQLDRRVFPEAILNLLLNAEQAMPNGGQITLQAAYEPPDVVLSVIDTGKGMTPEVLAKAFQPFFSTRSGGTGLGLATTRRIVEAHGGSIKAESEVGRGTKFTVRLPVTALKEYEAPQGP